MAIRKLTVSDALFMQAAESLAAKGTCECAKIGAVIVNSDNEIVSTGYNGAPSGLPSCTDARYKIGEGAIKNGCIHAELNAIATAARYGIKIDGCSLYCTCAPCYACSHAIIVSGIKNVIYLQEYRADGLDLLRLAGITIKKMSRKILLYG